MTDGKRATPSEIRTFFGPDSQGDLVKLTEFKTLKATDGTKPGFTAYDEIAEGIGNGSLTY